METQMDEDAVEGVEQNSNTPNMVFIVSELGQMVLSDPFLSRVVMECVLSAVWWPDTTVSMKATLLLSPIIKYWNSVVRQSNSFPSGEWATYVLTNVLNGLQILGYDYKFFYIC